MTILNQTGIEILNDLLAKDEMLKGFYDTGGVYPIVIEKLVDLKYHPERPHIHDTYPIEVKEVLVAATSYCNEVTKAKDYRRRSNQIVGLLGSNYRPRDLQLVLGISYLLLMTHYTQHPKSSKIAELLEGEFCQDRYSRFHTGRALYRRILSGEFQMAPINNDADLTPSKEKELDSNVPMSADEEIEFLEKKKCHIYCPGDLVQGQNAEGKNVPLRITGIRPNSIQGSCDTHNVRVHTSDINDVLDRLCKFLAESRKNVTTVPALCVLYGVAIMEVDNTLVRLVIDKGLLGDGFILSFGEAGWRVKYRTYMNKLESLKREWGYMDFTSNDNACYFNPGFGFEEFESKHQDLWKALQERIDKVITVLHEMQSAIERPSKETLMKMYGMLESTYLQNDHLKFLEEYETFLVGTPKSIMRMQLEGKLLDMESEIKGSGLLEYMGVDSDTALHKLYNTSEGDWDKEQVARYIFGHRKELSMDQVLLFFKYTHMRKRIKEDLETVQTNRPTAKTEIAKVEPEQVAEVPAEISSDGLTPQVMTLLRQMKALNIPFQINIAPNGDIVGFKANESYGDNYNMMPGSCVTPNSNNPNSEEQ